MGGINLLDQLKGKKSGGGLSSSPSPRMNLSLGPNPGEAVGLILRAVFLVILGYGGYLALENYQEEQGGKIQAELKKVQDSIAQENKKKAEMKNIDEEMRGYLARVEELQGKLKAVSQQETDRSYLIRALEYVALEMPKEMWLSEVSTQRTGVGGSDKSTPVATFRGFAINAQAVSEFIQKLEASVYFPSTTLDRLELAAGQEAGATPAGQIPIPPNSRKFQIMAKLGE
jgi:hypothetical protein